MASAAASWFVRIAFPMFITPLPVSYHGIVFIKQWRCEDTHLSSRTRPSEHSTNGGLGRVNYTYQDWPRNVHGTWNMSHRVIHSLLTCSSGLLKDVTHKEPLDRDGTRIDLPAISGYLIFITLIYVVAWAYKSILSLDWGCWPPEAPSASHDDGEQRRSVSTYPWRKRWYSIQPPLYGAHPYSDWSYPLASAHWDMNLCIHPPKTTRRLEVDVADNQLLMEKPKESGKILCIRQSKNHLKSIE